MKSLQTIQKTFRVFQILTKIAFILSIVGASLCAAGALCAVAWYTGGPVFGIFGEPVTIFASGDGMNQMLAVMLSDLILLVTDAILLAFAGRYLKTEQADGTPFTENGANLIRRLGIRCIWMPIVATGIVMILASLIFRYGAELEHKNGSNGDKI